MARPPSPRREASLRSSAPEDATHTIVGRRTLWTIILAAIFVVLGIVIGMAIVSKRDSHPIDVPVPGGKIPLLQDPGPWKKEANGPQTDGVEVEGQGRILFGTGEGRDPGGTIALDAVPEAPMEIPMEGRTAPQIAPPPPGEAPRQVPQEAKPVASKPVAPHPAKPEPKPAAKSEKAEPPVNLLPEKLHPAAEKPVAGSAAAKPANSSASLQLGAFSSNASAQAAWKSLSGRLSYLSGHEPVISPVARDGKTLYRLRIHAGSAAEAQGLCQRLKVAGEACSVVH